MDTIHPIPAQSGDAEAYRQERAELAARVAGDGGPVCRHCGQPVVLGVDGALLNARLGLDDPTPLPYGAHLVCQVRKLEELAQASHEAIARWESTAAGLAVLVNDGRSE